MAKGAASNGQHFGFLGLHQLVDLGNRLVRQLLDFVLRTTVIVFRDFLVLEQTVHRRLPEAPGLWRPLQLRQHLCVDGRHAKGQVG